MGLLLFSVTLLAALANTSNAAGGARCFVTPTETKSPCNSETVDQLFPEVDRGIVKRCMADGSLKFEGCIVHGSDKLITEIGLEFDDGRAMWRQCKPRSAIAKACLAYDKKGEREQVELFALRDFPDPKTKTVRKQCTNGGWMNPEDKFNKCGAEPYLPPAPEKSKKLEKLHDHSFAPDGGPGGKNSDRPGGHGYSPDARKAEASDKESSSHSFSEPSKPGTKSWVGASSSYLPGMGPKNIFSNTSPTSSLPPASGRSRHTPGSASIPASAGKDFSRPPGSDHAYGKTALVMPMPPPEPARKEADPERIEKVAAAVADNKNLKPKSAASIFMAHMRPGYVDPADVDPVSDDATDVSDGDHAPSDQLPASPHGSFRKSNSFNHGTDEQTKTSSPEHSVIVGDNAAGHSHTNDPAAVDHANPTSPKRSRHGSKSFKQQGSVKYNFGSVDGAHRPPLKSLGRSKSIVTGKNAPATLTRANSFSGQRPSEFDSKAANFKPLEPLKIKLPKAPSVQIPSINDVDSGPNHEGAHSADEAHRASSNSENGQSEPSETFPSAPGDPADQPSANPDADKSKQRLGNPSETQAKPKVHTTLGELINKDEGETSKPNDFKKLEHNRGKESKAPQESTAAVEVPLGKLRPWKIDREKVEKRVGTVKAITTGIQRTIIMVHIPNTDKNTPVYIRGGVTGMNRGVAFGSGGAKGCKGQPSVDGKCRIAITKAKHVMVSKAMSYLDWTSPEGAAPGTALVWSTNNQSAPGAHPINTYGPDHWVLDVKMFCAESNDGYFEIQTNVNGKWEDKIQQTKRCAGADVSLHKFESTYHVGMCGFVNVFNLNNGPHCGIYGMPSMNAAELALGRSNLKGSGRVWDR